MQALSYHDAAVGRTAECLYNTVSNKFRGPLVCFDNSVSHVCFLFAYILVCRILIRPDFIERGARCARALANTSKIGGMFWICSACCVSWPGWSKDVRSGLARGDQRSTP